jgi:hypothetical protein
MEKNIDAVVGRRFEMGERRPKLIFPNQEFCIIIKSIGRDPGKAEN